jgi:hypothetical protein
MAEPKLQKTPGREGQYWLELPDKREIVVGKVLHSVRHVNLRRSMISERLETRWRWEVQDFVSQQVAGRQGYKTRTEALNAAQEYARVTPMGVVQEETD